MNTTLLLAGAAGLTVWALTRTKTQSPSTISNGPAIAYNPSYPGQPSAGSGGSSGNILTTATGYVNSAGQLVNAGSNLVDAIGNLFGSDEARSSAAQSGAGSSAGSASA